MSNNPKQEVQNTSKKLRPIKLSDEKFELFYKEIYAEFGPKDVPPVEVNRQVKEVAPEPVAEEVPQVVAEEVVEEVPQVVVEETVEEEVPQAVVEETVEEEVSQVVVEETVEEEIFQEVPVAEPAPRMAVAEPAEDLSEEFPMEPVCAPEEETAQAKAAAVICDVQGDEVIHEGVKPKKSRAVTALIVILCMEAVAIAGLAAYWLLQMS